MLEGEIMDMLLSDDQLIRTEKAFFDHKSGCSYAEAIAKAQACHLLRILKTKCVRDWGKLNGEQIYDQLAEIEKDI